MYERSVVLLGRGYKSTGSDFITLSLNLKTENDYDFLLYHLQLFQSLIDEGTKRVIILD